EPKSESLTFARTLQETNQPPPSSPPRSPGILEVGTQGKVGWTCIPAAIDVYGDRMAPDPEGRTETTEGEGRSGATTRPVLSQPETAGTRWLALLQALRSRPLLEQAALLAAVPALAHLAQLLVIMFGRL